MSIYTLLMTSMERRPIKTRDQKWVQSFAGSLARAGISPNGISVSSVVFAMMTFGAFWQYAENPSWILMVWAIATIQLRLLANLMDGLVAIEYNKKSKTGDLYNDVPDRISDALVFMGLAFVLGKERWGTELCYLAAILSILTAYIRVLGSSLGVKELFLGPMAKPHRMAALSAACLVAILWPPILYWAIIVINLGLVLTCVRRLQKISNFMNRS